MTAWEKLVENSSLLSGNAWQRLNAPKLGGIPQYFTEIKVKIPDVVSITIVDDLYISLEPVYVIRITE